jgi:hypothetical protein
MCQRGLIGTTGVGRASLLILRLRPAAERRERGPR